MNSQLLNKITNGNTKKGGISSFSQIELCKIKPNPNQPRKSFIHIEELASSIKLHGLMQPISVKKCDCGYIIISGERRFKAYQYLELKTIKTHIIDVDDHKVQEMALIENIQREDLNDFEKAKFIGQLWDSGKYEAKKDLASAIGKSSAYISKAFSCLKLEPQIIQDIENNLTNIPVSVLDEISRVKDKQLQVEIYHKYNTGEIVRDDIKKFKPSKSKISRGKIEKKETQLYAMIKKSSRRYSQQSYHTDDNNKPIPFEITIPTINGQDGQAKGGVGGNYYIEDLNFYVVVNDEFLRLK